MTISDRDLKTVIHNSEEIELINYRYFEMNNQVIHSSDINASICFEYDLQDYDHKTTIKQLYNIQLLDDEENEYQLTADQLQMIQNFLDKHLKGIEYYGNTKIFAV